MHTPCTNNKMEFEGLAGRRLEGRFNAGQITSDAGGLLLGEVAGKMKVFGRVADCFTDYREPSRGPLARCPQFVAQRVYGRDRARLRGPQ